jgi:hypothetical protein
MRVQEIWVELKLNESHQLLVYASVADLLDDSINTVMKDKLLQIKQVGPKMNKEKTKCMLMSHHKNAKKKLHIKITNKCFENKAEFMYLLMPITS